jgi:hypothetical protein
MFALGVGRTWEEVDGVYRGGLRARSRDSEDVADICEGGWEEVGVGTKFPDAALGVYLPLKKVRD